MSKIKAIVIYNAVGQILDLTYDRQSRQEGETYLNFSKVHQILDINILSPSAKTRLGANISQFQYQFSPIAKST